MSTWIALLRGINVTGKHIVPMAKLRKDLGELGLERVRTYIQSGNVVFESASRSARALQERIATAIDREYGFLPMVLVLKRDQLRSALEANPYPHALDDPKSLHFYFLPRAVNHPDFSVLEAVRAATENFELHSRVFYLHAPDGIGRSRLADRIDRALGTSSTARNVRTVRKLLQLAEA